LLRRGSHFGAIDDPEALVQVSGGHEVEGVRRSYGLLKPML
jgi:hypothetical protein